MALCSQALFEGRSLLWGRNTNYRTFLAGNHPPWMPDFRSSSMATSLRLCPRLHYQQQKKIKGDYGQHHGDRPNWESFHDKPPNRFTVGPPAHHLDCGAGSLCTVPAKRSNNTELRNADNTRPSLIRCPSFYNPWRRAMVAISLATHWPRLKSPDYADGGLS